MADSAIRRYESDRGNPTEKTLKRIAKALSIDFFDLMEYDNPEQSSDDIINVISQYEAICSVILEDERVPDELKQLIREDLPTNPMAALAVLSLQALEFEKLAIDLQIEQSPLMLTLSAFSKLNPTGQQKAVERVEELTEIPKYQKAPPQTDAQDGEE